MSTPTASGPSPSGGGPGPSPRRRPRPAVRAPKGRDRDREDRRAMTDILVGRLVRGVLLPAEGVLLAEHLREEQRAGDETRAAMAGTTQALEAVRAELAHHREAADAAIVEAEQRADTAVAALERVLVLAAQLEEFAENALRVPDRVFYASVARSIREAAEGTAAENAHAA